MATSYADRWSPEPSGTPERTAGRLSLAGGALALAVGLAIVALPGEPSLVAQAIPLAVSVLLLGLPHGAVDHLVLPRARGESVDRRALAFVGLLYLVVGGAYAVVWFLTPAVAFALFILVTLLHWGQGDVYALDRFLGADHVDDPAGKVATLLVRGGAPMLVPLVAFPEQYALVAGWLVGLFDPGAAAALEPAFTPPARASVAVGYGLLVAGALVRGYRRASDRRAWRIDAAEVAALIALFVLVPPILAIGLYFTLWHSLRHVLRTILVDPVGREALETGQHGRVLTRFVRDSLPLTVAALAIFGGLALLVPRTPAGGTDLLALYLVGIAIVTLPHVVVVTLLDRIEAVWGPAPNR